MPLPSGPAPWFGLDQATLRHLEIHPAQAVAIPGRGWRDLGDALLLFSAAEKDPFFNRLTAVRWPSDPRAFDARLRQAIELFDGLDRRPYLWLIPGLSQPDDIVARLVANGFVDQGGGFDMILTRDPHDGPGAALPGDVVLERWNCPPPEVRGRVALDLAIVIGEAFRIPEARRANLALEISLTMEQPRFHACILRIDGEPVATGERYTFDGASYISSIGTRNKWRGRGLASYVTEALARDSLDEGCDLVYLGVYAENLQAIRLYQRLGFHILGPRSADMLLEHPGAAAGLSDSTVERPIDPPLGRLPIVRPADAPGRRRK